jgi:hypothetical protein
MGIIFFNLPKKTVFPHTRASFNVSNDFIPYTSSASTALSLSTTDVATMTRYSVTAKAPLSLYGESRIYAVPYIAFEKGNSVHYISNCMFNPVLNSAQSFASNVGSDTFLTLGVAAEQLGSIYKLGSL